MFDNDVDAAARMFVKCSVNLSSFCSEEISSRIDNKAASSSLSSCRHFSSSELILTVSTDLTYFVIGKRSLQFFNKFCSRCM